MANDINTLEREKQEIKRKLILDRIDKLIDWLTANSVCDAEWDVNVRELNACEAQLSQMDHIVKKTNCIEYGVSLKVSVPIQY